MLLRTSVRRVHRVVRVIWFSLRELHRPVRMVLHYLARTSPPEVRFRDGTVVLLSSHPHDLITVLVVFCFMDYGEVDRDSVVVDVGANIGAYTVFAARAGASAVVSYEPNPEAYRTLRANISANGLENVTAHQVGVGGSDGVANVSPSSSPYNRLGADVSDAVSVDVRSIGGVVSDDVASRVDLLKLDCEGAEYEIVAAITSEMASQISRIRMEFEPGEGDITSMVSHLGDVGYSTELLSREPNRLWMVRGAAV